MHALIGYLVTVAVFVGGGYAGMQWLTAPQEIAAPVEMTRSADPARSTRARVLARRKNEAAAERAANKRPFESVTADEVAALPAPRVRTASVPAAIPPADVSSIVEPEQPAAQRPAEDVKQETQPLALPISNPAILLDNSVRTAASIAGALAAVASAQQLATMPDVASENAEAAEPRSSKPIAAFVPGSPVRVSASREDKNVRVKAERRTRFAARTFASRKPVLMILRTIEYPDGRREQRLLPMPRYRQALAQY